MADHVDHPAHYGGADNPYEVIKVIEAWKLDFNLGNAIKYIGRAGHKDEDVVTDLRKAMWYIDRQIYLLVGNDHLQRVGHICKCTHTLGAHSSKTKACQVCNCLSFHPVGESHGG